MATNDLCRGRRAGTRRFASPPRRHARCVSGGMLAHGNGAITIQGVPLGLAAAHTSTVVGLESRAIRIEVCCSRGPAFFQMVGLAQAAVREARVRVASALSR